MLNFISVSRNAKMEKPLIILKYQNRKYPVIGVPNNVSGVFFRTRLKEWIDCANMFA